MSALQQSNSFSAHLALAAGVAVSITAGTMAELAQVVGKLQGAEPAANDGRKEATVSKVEPAGNAAGSTGTAAGAQGAASGSASEGEAKRPTYDDVKDRVLKLAKVSRETATKALAKFGVDHGNKLKLEQYPEFIAHADELLKVAA